MVLKMMIRALLLSFWLLCSGIGHALAHGRHVQLKEDTNDESSAFVPSSFKEGGCGFQDPSLDHLRVMQQNEVEFSSSTSPGILQAIWSFILCIFFPDRDGCVRTQRITTIPVFVHNLQLPDGTGRLSEDDIREMIRQANVSFNGAGFQLTLRWIDRRTSQEYYEAMSGTDEERRMMTALKEGGVETLNVYLKRARDARGDYCGLANLASSAEGIGVRDGVTVSPGCALDQKTLAHEVGHWLNLLHTFSGGCSPPGDLVDDTPAQSEFVGRIAGDCPDQFPDSCPNQPGLDNLDNMMDYNPVNCKDEFTEGQIDRMRKAWREYRTPSFW